RASWEALLLVRLQPVAWASLVITGGPAAADALDSWSSAHRALASVILWAIWGAVLLASFAPRPTGLTTVRVTAPVAVELARTAARTVYALSQRWAVLVPAGIVLKDPLILVNPVLFPRDRIASLRPLPFPTAPADDVLDLRLGAAAGSLVLELTEEAQLFRA